MSNPIQQAIEALNRSLSWLSSYPGGGTMRPDGPYEQSRAALSALQSLQGVELPEPAGYRYRSTGRRQKWVHSGPTYAPGNAEPIYTADQLRTAVAAAMARGVATDMYCTCGNEWQWNTDVGSWELVASFIPDEVSDVAQPTQAEVVSDREALSVIAAFPITDEKNMDAVNMRDVARRAVVRAALATQQAGQGEAASDCPACKGSAVRGFKRGVKCLACDGTGYTPPAPQQPERTPLEQYDLDQSPEYRKGYEDGRLKGFEVGQRYAREWATQPTQAEAPSERAHVGDSRFEQWFGEDFDPKNKGTKQQMREAYEAGMNDRAALATQQAGPTDPLWPVDGLYPDMQPPATSRDRWMYDQGRLAERRLSQQPEARKCHYNGGTCTRRGCAIECQGSALALASRSAQQAGQGEAVALAQQERDREDAERWREWLRGNALTVVVPTPTEKNPASKTTIVYAPSPFPAFAEAMNAAIDTIRAARSSEGGSPSPSMVGREVE